MLNPHVALHKRTCLHMDLFVISLNWADVFTVMTLGPYQTWFMCRNDPLLRRLL